MKLVFNFQNIFSGVVLVSFTKNKNPGTEVPGFYPIG
jgi:hypothetical protein